ncbi:MAG: LemA family protein [Odoribacteraceae bacterium]|jgi:LemA protein|nr:LemA family protein [Odoribacteraceae bacterium]
MTTALIIAGGVVVVLLLWLIVTHNKFVFKNNRVKQTESTILVMLKQRNDMIPNLVATVQGYAGHENATLVRIAELRSLLQQAGDEHEQMQIGTELSKALADVKVTVERYPNLKADAQFRRLQESIEAIENQIQAARRTFNAAAVDFNNYVEMLPSSFIASLEKRVTVDLITIPESERENVNVRELFNQ